MKRQGFLFEKIVSQTNLYKAFIKARKGKRHYQEVKEFEKNLEWNIWNLKYKLENKTYRVSEYSIFTIFEPKERIISKLPFIDRVVHHALMNILEPILTKSLITSTYSCIVNRGIHKCMFAVRDSIKPLDYCLKFDIKKFYPSIDNEKLKQLLRRKLKDQDIIWLIDLIIDSCKGLPLGNYTSQHFGNFYLNKFDHWIKQDLGIKRYFRYCDDIVIIHSDKRYLYILKHRIIQYLREVLNLEVSNYQVFPINKRPIDFVGYCIDYSKVKIRKSIKQNFKRMMKNPKINSINSYMGWLNHGNCKNLISKTLNK